MRFILAMLVVSSIANASGFLDTLAAIESSNNARAIGDGGRSLGLFQIKRSTWRDATARLGVRWQHSDAFNQTRARIVALNHVEWLEARFRDATGRAPSQRDMYAMWNLGFEGYQRREFAIERAPEATRRNANLFPEGNATSFRGLNVGINNKTP